METNWRAIVRPEDLVLVPGDISWATHFEDALVDLRWLDALPGTKSFAAIMIFGGALPQR
jgi:predicted phosphohydrolase